MGTGTPWRWWTPTTGNAKPGQQPCSGLVHTVQAVQAHKLIPWLSELRIILICEYGSGTRYVTCSRYGIPYVSGEREGGSRSVTDREPQGRAASGDGGPIGRTASTTPTAGRGTPPGRNPTPSGLVQTVQAV